MEGYDATTPSGVTTRYRRLMRLSEGGMGVVDLCVREGGRFQRLYALKRLKPVIRADQESREMFIEEARLAGLVHHPNVVGVLDVGEDEEGPFLVMEYIEGVTARDVARHASRSGVPLPVEVAIEIITQSARGLGQAHTQTNHSGTALQLIHRDVSPHNILIDYTGTAQVTDFGVARAVGSRHQTSSGILKGKLGYMAPEVLRFENLDARTDIFALGVVFYELLAARRLYAGEDSERASRIVNEPPPDIAAHRNDVPAEVQSLLGSMLAKDPVSRPQSAIAIAEVLDTVLSSLRARPDSCRLRDFVLETFGEVRLERRDKIRKALEGVPSAKPEDADLEVGRSAPATDEVSRIRSARPASRRVLAVAGIAGVLVLGLLVGVRSIGTERVQNNAGPALAQPIVRAPAEEPTAPETAAPIVQEAPARQTPVREAPPQPLTVSIRVSSVPSGADLRVDGNLESTPAVIRLPRREEPVDLEFSRRGYLPTTRSIVPNRDGELEVVLQRRLRRATMMESTMTPSGLNEIWDE